MLVLSIRRGLLAEIHVYTPLLLFLLFASLISSIYPSVADAAVLSESKSDKVYLSSRPHGPTRAAFPHNPTLLSTKSALSMVEMSFIEHMLASGVSQIYIRSTAGSIGYEGPSNQPCIKSDLEQGSHEGSVLKVTYRSFFTSDGDVNMNRNNNNNNNNDNSNNNKYNNKGSNNSSSASISYGGISRSRLTSFREIRSRLSSVLQLAVDFDNHRSAPFALHIDDITLSSSTTQSQYQSQSQSQSSYSIAQVFEPDSCIVCTDSIEAWLTLFGRDTISKSSRETIQSIIQAPYRHMVLSIEVSRESDSTFDALVSSEVVYYPLNDDASCDSTKHTLYDNKDDIQLGHNFISADSFDSSNNSGSISNSSSNSSSNSGSNSSNNGDSNSNNNNNSNNDNTNKDSRIKNINNIGLSLARDVVDGRKHTIAVSSEVINPTDSDCWVTVHEPLPHHYSIYLHTLKYWIVASKSSNDNNVTSSNESRNLTIISSGPLAAIPSFKLVNPTRILPSQARSQLIFGSVSFSIIIPARSKLRYHFIAQRKALHRDSYASDSSRGEAILPVVVQAYTLISHNEALRQSETILLSDNPNVQYNKNENTSSTSSTSSHQVYPHNNYPKLYTSSSPLTIAVFPDFTMPYNVMIMVSTAMVFLMGCLFNALIGDKHFLILTDE